VITVERTDFVSVPVTDMQRSIAFYGETLGLPRASDAEGWAEFQLGENVSLYLVDPTNIGRAFEGPHTSSIALRVPDVEAAQRALEAKAWSSSASRSTRASATWRSSTTPTATR